MSHINLLPWREKQREAEKRFFCYVLASGFVFGLFMVGIVYEYFSSQINYQDSRNQLLDTELKELDRIAKIIQGIKKEHKLLQRKINIVQSLQSARSLTVYFLDELVLAIPETIFLTKLTRKGDQIILEGVADSNAAISDFMRKLEDSPCFSYATLMEIKGGETPKTYVFKLQMQLAVHDENKSVGKTS